MSAQKLWFEQKVMIISMTNAGDKVIVSAVFENEETIDISAAEMMDLIRNGKISVSNIDMLRAMGEEFLAYFPLVVK